MMSDRMGEGFLIKWLQNFSLESFPAITLEMLLMKLGYDTFGGDVNSFIADPVEARDILDNDMKKYGTLVSLAYGPAALRLAMSPSEVGAVAGVAMLAVLGLKAGLDFFGMYTAEITKKIVDLEDAKREELHIPPPPDWLATVQPCGNTPPVAMLAVRSGQATILYKPVCWDDDMWSEYSAWQTERDRILSLG